MREIRFRIWDDKRKEWVHDTEHAVNLLGETIIMGEILRRPDDKFVTLEEMNDLVVMQYTGLKDKNGKEIYEDDIICDGHSLKARVVWDAEWAAWGTLYGPNPAGYTRGRHIDESWATYEVIGNIYENPELPETTQ